MKLLTTFFIVFSLLYLPSIAIADTDEEKLDSDDIDLKTFYISMPGKIDYFYYVVDRTNNLCFAYAWYATGNKGGAGLTTIDCAKLTGSKEIAAYLNAGKKAESKKADSSNTEEAKN